MKLKIDLENSIDEEIYSIDEEIYNNDEEIYDEDNMNTTCRIADINMNNYLCSRRYNCASSFEHYIASIKKYRLLKQSEEAELCKLIQKGIKAKKQFETNDYKNNCKQIDETIKTLLKIKDDMHKGELAKQKLVNHNLRLVVSIAKMYTRNNCDFFDLVQEGNIGLMAAADKFDYTTKNKFSTYASVAITRHIVRYICKASNTIRIPVYVMEKIYKIKRTFAQLTKEFGREPSSKEVGQRLGIDSEEVDRLYAFGMYSVSLEAELNYENIDDLTEYKCRCSGGSLDKEQESAEDIIIRNELHNDIMKILNSNDIKHRDRDIIIARFGLDGSDGKTLAEIGDKYGLTREAVRQIENRVLEKLRRHKHRKIIEAYIN